MAKHSTPLVSIVTPSLNQGRYIEETILSVRHQTYPALEHVIMDGGSTDNTIGVVQKYCTEGNIRWFSKQDAGQYDAVNKGWHKARGEIFGWINADDVYIEDAVEKVVKVFQNNPDVDIVYGKLYSTSEPDKHVRILFSRPFSKKWLRRYCYTNPSVSFVRAHLVRAGFSIDTSIPTYGDWDWFLRMAEAGKKFYYLPEFLGYFRIHEQSRIMRMGKATVIRERLLIGQRHGMSLGYMRFWIDICIPWIERFQNLWYLLRTMQWHQIVKRLPSLVEYARCAIGWHIV